MLNNNGAEEAPTPQGLQGLLMLSLRDNSYQKSKDMRSKELKDFRYSQNLQNTGIIKGLVTVLSTLENHNPIFEN